MAYVRANEINILITHVYKLSKRVENYSTLFYILYLYNSDTFTYHIHCLIAK